jgi:2-keto-4-pentenoate hydratase
LHDLVMLDADLRAAADALAAAERDRSPIEAPTATWPEMTVAEAYRVQQINISRRLEGGARVVGHKVGLTAKAMQEMLGVSEPDYGVLLDDMVFDDPATLQADDFCYPRVEIELAYVIGQDLTGPGVGIADVLAATDHVVPALEVIDSRVRDWKITLTDTVADNASSARVVRGRTPLAVKDLGDAERAATLYLNGAAADHGRTTAVMGDPAAAVAWLANKLGELGSSLRAGDLVMPGSCTRAVDVNAGDEVRGEVDGIGSATVHFA